MAAGRPQGAGHPTQPPLRSREGRSMRPRLTLRTVAVLGAGVLALPVLTSAGYGAATPSRATVAGSLPDWVASARQTGAPAASKKMSVNVVLPLRNAAAAEQLAA